MNNEFMAGASGGMQGLLNAYRQHMAQKYNFDLQNRAAISRGAETGADWDARSEYMKNQNAMQNARMDKQFSQSDKLAENAFERKLKGYRAGLYGDNKDTGFNQSLAVEKLQQSEKAAYDKQYATLVEAAAMAGEPMPKYNPPSPRVAPGVRPLFKENASQTNNLTPMEEARLAIQSMKSMGQ